ncbi:MAG TPA: hypothetical protein DIC30_01500 [Oceanospirillales bacterium]|nr:hypothetical protein [Oleispira sp.]HCM04662.1 hypothetical protein [Oceanospirillales bacterium]|tara:strand:+ start:10575 stop:11189 length:615 start_codon:yes stop_codon:yes gene_type:complete
MNLNDALAIIAGFSNSFSKKKTQQFVGTSSALTEGTNKVLPTELVEYIDHICPESGLIVKSVGHPVELLKSSDLALKPSMFTGLTGELGKWQDDWFLIAHEGGDPIIVKTSEWGENSPVYSAMQGMGFWDFAPIADSIGQFLICICAVQYALNFPGVSEPLDDDFNLAPAAANWLFPLLRQYAGAHYDEWASVFENYQTNYQMS